MKLFLVDQEKPELDISLISLLTIPNVLLLLFHFLFSFQIYSHSPLFFFLPIAMFLLASAGLLFQNRYQRHLKAYYFVFLLCFLFAFSCKLPLIQNSGPFPLPTTIRVQVYLTVSPSALLFLELPHVHSPVLCHRALCGPPLADHPFGCVLYFLGRNPVTLQIPAPVSLI